MGNLYRLNSLFELEITRPIEEISQNPSLLERNTVYEYLFLVISKEDDFTILSEPASKELLEYWKENKIEIGDTILTDMPYYPKILLLNGNIPEDITLIEWGKTSILDTQKGFLLKNDNILNHSIYNNSKINQTRWKESSGFNRLTSLICTDKNELDFCIANFRFPLVIKPEFGFSGRGIFILRNDLDFKKYYKQILEMFSVNTNGIIIEEWVGNDKILDFSGIYDLSAKRPQLITYTKMLVDKMGIYRGTIIEKKFGKEFGNGMKGIISSYQIDKFPYNGSITMDGFTFTRDGLTQIQYMSEINFRYSMGRILYELHQKIGKGLDNCGLFFFPIRNKRISFRYTIIGLEILKAKYKMDLLILTPLHNAKSKLNPFVGIYSNSSEEISLEIVDEIKKLFV